MEVKKRYAHFDVELPPVILVESVAQGWRGLTMDGLVLNVEPSNGRVAEIPYGGNIAVTRNGVHIGHRTMPRQSSPGMIDRYLRCFNISRQAVASERLPNALVAIETAMSFAPTLAAQYNRGMILLAMGEWQEGFADYANAMEYPGSAFMRPQYRDCIDAGLQRWRGEDIKAKKLLLIHDHGLGDSIMMLRYVPILRAMGAEVILWVPPELRRLASQCAPLADGPVSADYFCSLLFLLQVLKQMPHNIPLEPYLKIDSGLIEKWRTKLVKPTTGIAWLAQNTGHGDYPRNIEPAQIVKALPGVNLINIQQGVDEIPGIQHLMFEDFADCAAAMMCCERIITIDTAAVHLAGAIGHPNVKLLLSHWASWRWRSLLYAELQICWQDTLGDWDSALAKL